MPFSAPALFESPFQKTDLAGRFSDHHKLSVPRRIPSALLAVRGSQKYRTCSVSSGCEPGMAYGTGPVGPAQQSCRADSSRSLRAWPRSCCSGVTLGFQQEVAWHPRAFQKKMIPAHTWWVVSVCCSPGSVGAECLPEQGSEMCWKHPVCNAWPSGNFLPFTLRCLCLS